MGSDRGVRRWEERDGVLSTVSRAPGEGEAGERERGASGERGDAAGGDGEARQGEVEKDAERQA